MRKIQDLPVLICPFTGNPAAPRRFISDELVEYAARASYPFTVSMDDLRDHSQDFNEKVGEMGEIAKSLLRMGARLVRGTPRTEVLIERE